MRLPAQKSLDLPDKPREKHRSFFMDYQELLNRKKFRAQQVGIEVSPDVIHPKLFPFQRDTVLWALRKGRALVGLDTGLGKTFVQLEWARLISPRTLIVAPLSVARQTVREAKKIDLDVSYVREQSQVSGDGIFITNYELAEKFDPAYFGAVVLDESSILKAIDGVTRRKLTKAFGSIPYRLCCTATPAPNDEAEIGMHSEYLGVLTNAEMLSTFFINANKIVENVVTLQDGRTARMRTKQSGKKGQEWRLRNYGKDQFYKWLASWGMMMSKPSDLGYQDDGFVLPPLNIQPIFIDVDYQPDGQLFFTGLKGIQDRTKVRKSTLAQRVFTAASMVNTSKEQWIVWCGLEEESSALHKAIPDSVEVKGSDSPEYKAEQLEAFQDGKFRVLISKPRIAGFGMNFQNAHNMVFVGLGDSWEQYYQCIRREWRFGQAHQVNVYIVLSEVERGIYDNVMRKEAMAAEMKRELIANMELYEREELNIMPEQKVNNYHVETSEGEGWKAILGDSCEVLATLPDDSVDIIVNSPPFADLYTYSASERDLGNCRDWNEFFEQYAIIVKECLRVIKPGCIACIHTADIPALQMKDGYIGLKDFPGHVIAAHEAAGWIYHGYAIVGKNPQAQAIRTKAKALLFTQMKKDSSCSRPAILDRVLFFKKPGDRAVPVTPVERGEMTNEIWIDWAGGIWTGIQESDTLQYTTARAPEDEKHICPLQLGTIERCLKMYSNPGETLLTPFMGIGSEAYQAVKFGRHAIGIELKESYYRVAVKNLSEVERQSHQVDLFTFAAKQDTML